MQRLRSYLTLALLLSAILALLSLTALLLRAQWTLEEMRLLVVDGRTAAKTWNNYSIDLTKQLQSEKNQKAIDAGLAAAAAVTGSVRLWNTQMMPRLLKGADALEQSALSFNGLVVNADRRLSADDGLLAESTRLLVSLRGTADAFGVDSRALVVEITALVKSGETSMEAVNKLVTSPEWLATLHNIERGTSNLADTTAAMPGTMEAIERIAKTSAKWQKVLLVGQLLATLSRAFW